MLVYRKVIDFDGSKWDVILPLWWLANDGCIIGQSNVAENPWTKWNFKWKDPWTIGLLSNSGWGWRFLYPVVKIYIKARPSHQFAAYPCMARPWIGATSGSYFVPSGPASCSYVVQSIFSLITATILRGKPQHEEAERYIRLYKPYHIYICGR